MDTLTSQSLKKMSSFELTKEAVLSNNELGIGSARAFKATSSIIITYCADNNIDLLNPKPEDLTLLSELSRFLVNEGFQCQYAMESAHAIKH